MQVRGIAGVTYTATGAPAIREALLHGCSALPRKGQSVASPRVRLAAHNQVNLLRELSE